MKPAVCSTGAEGGCVRPGCCGRICTAIAFRQWQSVGDAACQGNSAGDENWGVNGGGLLVGFVIFLRLEVGKATNISQCENRIHIPCRCLMLILAVSVNAGDPLIKLLNTDIPGSPNQASFYESSLKR